MKTLIVLCALLCAAYGLRTRAHTKGALCDFCMSFVGGIEKFLKEEEGPIEGYANILCDMLTKDNIFLDPICKSLLDNELDNIINWLNNDESPATVCPKLHLC